MSNNKGKDGEMKVTKVVCDIALRENGVDFTRPTNTNTADMGADMILESPVGFLERLENIALGKTEFSDKSVQTNDNSSTTYKTRIDVKATDRKLQSDTVDKFTADIRRHPDCKGHILIGGSGLTGPAKIKFNQVQVDAESDGKKVTYISNNGLSKIKNHYEAFPASDNEED